MKKQILAGAVAVILLAALVCTLSAMRREGSKGILYRVWGNGATAYLLGSIHIGTADMHPFGDALQEAMAEADVFVFESDTELDFALARLQVRQTLPEGTTLRDALGDELYGDVTAACKELRINAASLEQSLLWAVINSLALYSSAAEIGAGNVRKAVSLGVEATVRQYAQQHAKPFAYLETIDEIADTMESFSDDLTRYLLQEEIDLTLRRKPGDAEETVNQWPAWWRDGNAEAFRAYYSQSFDAADERLYLEYHEKLVAGRNALMAGRLDEILRQGGTYFVTVGLLHLIPEDDSILTRLRDMGYTVELLTP